jgi:hypothetical protein
MTRASERPTAYLRRKPAFKDGWFALARCASDGAKIYAWV